MTRTTIEDEARQRDAGLPVPPSVLVVEDDAHTRRLFTYVLSQVYRVEAVPGIEEALSRAAEEAFDAFLLDIHLRERRTGIDLLRALREQPAYRGAPAVACTAYAMPGDGSQFLAAGFDGYVSKPFTKVGLLEALASALTR